VDDTRAQPIYPATSAERERILPGTNTVPPGVAARLEELIAERKFADRHADTLALVRALPH
jgi:hypothetical protein